MSVKTGLNFGQALEVLKAGGLVARNGWNGKGMFLFQRPADEITLDTVVHVIKSIPQSVKDYLAQKIDFTNPGRLDGQHKIKFTAYICMYAADGSIVNGWLASQTDLLSNDWYDINE